LSVSLCVFRAPLHLSDPLLARIKLAVQLIGMPRHLGQLVGGFILTEQPLTQPCQSLWRNGRPQLHRMGRELALAELRILRSIFWPWALLTYIRKAFDLIGAHCLASAVNIQPAIPQEGSVVYDMLCKGDSVERIQGRKSRPR
jgi:error-prone DNA polymerase